MCLESEILHVPYNNIITKWRYKGLEFISGILEQNNKKIYIIYIFGKEKKCSLTCERPGLNYLQVVSPTPIKNICLCTYIFFMELWYFEE